MGRGYVGGAVNTNFKMAGGLCGEKTGDLKNHVVKLLREIQRMELQVKPDIKGWCSGDASSLLPVLHSALVEYSLPLAEWLMVQGYRLYAKSDLKFTEGVYRVLRHAFNYRPRLTQQQFLSKGYAERKVMLTCDLLLLCQSRHKQLTGTHKNTGKRDKRTGYGPQRNPPEVLTVREGKGIGSAWKEPIPVLSYAVDDPRHTPSPPPPSPRASPLKNTPTHNSTPSPNHDDPLPAHHHLSPIHLPKRPQSHPYPHKSPSSQPHPHTSPSSQPHPPTSPSSTPAKTSVYQCRQDNSSQVPGARRGGERGGEGEEEVKNWVPLPVAAEEVREKEMLLQDLSTRMGELTKVVEQMSARFVLMETQLMLRREEETLGRFSPEKLTPHTHHTSSASHPTPRNSYLHLPARPPGTTSHDSIPSPSLHWHKQRTTPHIRHTPFSLGSHIPPATSPSTEETRQLIDKLRSRAQKTRLFLQQATTSSSTGRTL